MSLVPSHSDEPELIDDWIIPVRASVAGHPVSIIILCEGHIAPVSEGVDLRQSRVEGV